MRNDGKNRWFSIAAGRGDAVIMFAGRRAYKPSESSILRLNRLIRRIPNRPTVWYFGDSLSVAWMVREDLGVGDAA